MLSIHDDAESQTESAAGGSIAGGYGRTLDLKLYDERLEKLESAVQSLQQATSDATKRVADMESGLYSLQEQVDDFDASQLQRYSRPQSATSHQSAVQTQSPRLQDPDNLLVITTQFPPQPADEQNAPLFPPNSLETRAPLEANSEAPPSPAPAPAKAVPATISVSHPPPSSSPATSPAQSLHSRRSSLMHFNSREVADKTRELFLDRPEERAAKEKQRAEELSQRVPLEDFLAVKAEAEATKKSLASSEILLKQLAVRVSGLEETCAPNAAITVLEGNTSKRIVGLEGRLRTLSSILSAKADSMTVDAVSASVEANAAGVLQLKDRLDSVLMADGEDKNASDYLGD